ncbi:MAG: SlyX family protein [Planctomycetota bacterium]
MNAAGGERIEMLEIQVAHLQRTSEQLNEVVTDLSLQVQRQSRVIDVLVQQTKDLKGKLATTREAPVDEKPPHY